MTVPHATTVVALRYADGVVMAGDRRATEGYSIAHRAMDKVFPADRWSAVAIAGAAGPAVEMVRLFQVQLEHYEKVEGVSLSLEGKANQLAQMVREHLPDGDAGPGRGAPVRRLRPAPGHRAHLHLRRHRRPLRGGRLPGHRARAGATPATTDQARLPGGPDPRPRRSSSPSRRSTRRPTRTRAPAGPDLVRGIYPLVAVVDADGYAAVERGRGGRPVPGPHRAACGPSAGAHRGGVSRG